MLPPLTTVVSCSFDRVYSTLTRHTNRYILDSEYNFYRYMYLDFVVLTQGPISFLSQMRTWSRYGGGRSNLQSRANLYGGVYFNVLLNFMQLF